MRVVIFLERCTWVAQCLEYDIAAQGATIPEVKRAMARAIAAQVIVETRAGQDPQKILSTFRPAPESYFKMFDMGEKLAEPISLPIMVVDALKRSTADCRLYT